MNRLSSQDQQLRQMTEEFHLMRATLESLASAPRTVPAASEAPTKSPEVAEDKGSHKSSKSTRDEWRVDEWYSSRLWSDLYGWITEEELLRTKTDPEFADLTKKKAAEDAIRTMLYNS